ncbi:MAG TPA: 50S ribosomal protein L10 [bacterium]|nr:50S ribosomal protein L10 [bacterium]HPN32561.1 50S ribosomal protein L10 [bacterium]
MRNPQKAQSAETIKQRVSKSDCVMVANLSGLNSGALTELRRNFKKNDSELFVTKNTLMRFAIKDTKYEPMTSLLKGENAFILSYKDPAVTAKVLSDFSTANKQFEIRGGVLSGKLISEAQINQLAKLPSKEVMLSQLLRTMNGPVSGFVNVLAGTIRQLMYAINAVKEQKSK